MQNIDSKILKFRCIQSTLSHPVSLISILISSHLCLGLLSGLKVFQPECSSVWSQDSSVSSD
jgi:hypothetical protein